MYGLQNPSFPHRNALPTKAAAARWLQSGKLDRKTALTLTHTLDWQKAAVISLGTAAVASGSL